MKIGKRIQKVILMSVVVVAVILVADQLYLFGVPFGGFLGDLSIYDPTGSPYIHHWMVGFALLCGVFYYLKNNKKKRLVQ